MHNTLFSLVLALVLSSCTVDRRVDCHARVTETTAEASCQSREEKELTEPPIAPEAPIDPTRKIPSSVYDNLPSSGN